MRAILDTCTVIWILEDSPRIGRRTRDLVSSEDSELSVSAASVAEMAIKARKGKLAVPTDLLGLLGRLEIRVMPITAEHAWYLSVLPNDHSDPFDRIIAAQGIIERMVVITVDAAIQRLGARTISPEL